MNEEKRSCIGYETIESRTIGSTEFVIGHNPKAPNPYVCWHCKDNKDYYWGYYTNTLDAAKEKMIERCETAAHRLSNSQKPPKKRDELER